MGKAHHRQDTTIMVSCTPCFNKMNILNATLNDCNASHLNVL